MGYEVVDNLPIGLVGNLVPQVPAPGAALAIGVDVRTRDFAIEALLGELAALAARSAVDVTLVFLDCDDEVLQQRFTETRRRHPLADDRPVSDGIRHERRMMAPLRARADLTLDTSDINQAALRRILAGHFALEVGQGLRVLVTSFAFRHGLPREADLVIDVRFLRNPHYVEELRALNGLDRAVADYVERDPGFAGFFERLCAMLLPLLPRYRAEGKSYLTIAAGCTGGRHRSVVVAERLAARLAETGLSIQLVHRDVDRRPTGD